MQAVRVTPSTRWVELVELEEPPTPRGAQVRVAVRQVGICPTDWAVMTGATGRYAASSMPLIIGHEMMGRAVELGRDVTGIRLGDLVVATVRRGCRVCVICLAGRSDLCSSGLYVERGVYEADGFMAEYILEDEANLVATPMALHEVAVLVEPLSLVVKAVSHVRAVQRGLPPRCGHEAHGWERARWARCKRVLVIGAGALGLLSALLLREAGAEVFLHGDPEPDSLQARILRLTGAEYLSSATSPLATLSDWVGQVDLVLEASGDPVVPQHLAPLMVPNALVLLLGPPSMDSAQPADVRGLWRSLAESNSAVLGAAAASREHFQEAVTALERLMKAFPALVPQLITHRFPVSRFQEAFTQRDPSVIKTVVDIA